MRLATRPLTAAAEAWGPADPEPFKRLAGSQFLGADGDLAVVRTQGGCVMHVHPGWLAIRPDGAGDGESAFAAPENIGGPLSTWAVVQDPGARQAAGKIV